MTEKKELLRVEGLKKYFNTPGGLLHAVDDVNFTLNVGETLGVVGESGCGKSTMGRTILRLHEHTAGKVFFEGKNIFEYNKQQMKDLRKDMQIIFQDPFASLNPRATVKNAIAEPFLVQGLYSRKDKDALDKRVSELMDLVGSQGRRLRKNRSPTMYTVSRRWTRLFQFWISASSISSMDLKGRSQWRMTLACPRCRSAV